MFEKFKINRAIKKIKQADGLYDPMGARGSAIDKTVRMRGSLSRESIQRNLEDYLSNGFVQNIVDIPAEDATREWIEIKTNMDDEENKVSRLIENRLNELGIRNKIKDLIRYSRMYPNGSMLYYAVISDRVQNEIELIAPLPSSIKEIEFINVIENMDSVSINIANKSQPTKKDYNKPRFRINGYGVHETRISWLVNSFIPSLDRGISIIKKISDAIRAQDSALWSTNSILSQMALKVFKSDFIADLDIVKRAELLAAMKHIMDTQSVIALMKDEEFIQQIYNVAGMREIFESVYDNLGGMARMPKNILFGKAHGVVTAGEYDTINYYAQIATLQENEIRPIIEKILDLIKREENGAIYQATNGNPDALDIEFTFNSLWKLDPLSQADAELKIAQRDQIDITSGKLSPQEARENDVRFANLENFEMERDITPDMDMPPLMKPAGLDE